MLSFFQDLGDEYALRITTVEQKCEDMLASFSSDFSKILNQIIRQVIR